jgi:hypothetical protein
MNANFIVDYYKRQSNVLLPSNLGFMLSAIGSLKLKLLRLTLGMWLWIQKWQSALRSVPQDMPSSTTH